MLTRRGPTSTTLAGTSAGRSSRSPASASPAKLLKVTTRIMHIVAWLLTQRAIESGEIANIEGRRPERRLGNAQDSDPLVVNQLPLAAQKLINSSSDLYARIKRIDEGSAEDEAPQIRPGH